MKTIIAIDPGKTGGIAFQHAGQPPCALPMPTREDEIVDLLHRLCADPGQTLALVELVGGYIAGRPAPGSAMFSFGNSYGFVKGLVMSLRVPLELVRPQRWQKTLALGNSRSHGSPAAWKKHLASVAGRLFPGIRVTRQIADALLILEFARRTPGLGAPRAAGD